MDLTSLPAAVAAERFSSGDVVSAITLIVYDYILTFPQEVKYIWNSPWTPGKVLFLVVRYLPLVDLPMWAFDDLIELGPLHLSCNFTTYWVMISLLVGDMVANVVYGLRTWALWNRNLPFGIFLVIVWLGSAVGAGAFMAVYQTNSSSSEQSVPGIPGCLHFSSRDDATYKAYIVALMFQVVVFVATVIKGVEQLPRHRRANLSTVLYRDAFVVSVAQLGMGLINIALVLGMGEVNYMLNGPFRAMDTVLPSRIIINLREAATGLDDWDLTRMPESITLNEWHEHQREDGEEDAENEMELDPLERTVAS